jgi:hypothetical protein
MQTKQTNLQTLLHDLAGPVTVLSMCFPEVEKQLDKGRNIPPSPHLHRCIQLCAAALQETQQKLKKLQVYGEEITLRN